MMVLPHNAGVHFGRHLPALLPLQQDLLLAQAQNSTTAVGVACVSLAACGLGATKQHVMAVLPVQCVQLICGSHMPGKICFVLAC